MAKLRDDAYSKISVQCSRLPMIACTATNTRIFSADVLSSRAPPRTTTAAPEKLPDVSAVPLSVPGPVPLVRSDSSVQESSTTNEPPWKALLVNQTFSVELQTAIALARGIKASSLDKETDSATTVSCRRWLSSPLFRNGLVRPGAVASSTQRGWDLLCRLAHCRDLSTDPECMRLVEAMRAVVREDLTGAGEAVSHAAHAVCAALLWHHNLANEAVALAEQRRTVPSITMKKLWTQAQFPIRNFVDTENKLIEERFLYSREKDGVSSVLNVLDCVIERAQLLLHIPCASDAFSTKRLNGRLLTAAVQLARWQLVGNKATSEMRSVAKASSLKQWFHETIIRRRAVMAQKAIPLVDIVISFAQIGPNPDLLWEMTAERELGARDRCSGVQCFDNLLFEAKSADEKLVVLNAIHDAFDISEFDYHYLSHLQGVPLGVRANVLACWRTLFYNIVHLLKSTVDGMIASKSFGSDTVKLVALGLQVISHEYLSEDAILVKDSGLISLLNKCVRCPVKSLRSVAFKTTYFLFERCCSQQPASRQHRMVRNAQTHPSKVRDLSGSVSNMVVDANDLIDGADAVLPGLIHIIHSQLTTTSECLLRGMGNPNALPAVSKADGQKSSDFEVFGRPASWILQSSFTGNRKEPGFVVPHTVINVEQPHTMSMWVWLPNEGEYDGTLFVKGGSANSRLPWSQVVVSVLDWKIKVSISDGTEDGFQVIAPVKLLPGGWTHIAYTVDIASAMCTLFYNGDEVAKKELSKSLKYLNTLAWAYETVIETSHNYQPNMDKYWDVAVPGAVGYSVCCDSRSKTEAGNDFLRFYRGKGERKVVIGADKYSGDKFPGKGLPDLYIDDSAFELHFHSNASKEDWGFKATVTAYVIKSGADTTKERLQASKMNAGASVYDLSPHPFYFGEPPSYVTSQRCADAVVARVCCISGALSGDMVARLPAVTAFDMQSGGLSSDEMLLADDGGDCRFTCAYMPGLTERGMASQVPIRNKYARVPTKNTNSMFSFKITKFEETQPFGFSCGFAPLNSVLKNSQTSAPFVFGETLASYGVFFDGSAFVLKSSRSRKRTKIPSSLCVGDVICIEFHPDESLVTFKVQGSQVNINQIFALSTNHAAAIKAPATAQRGSKQMKNRAGVVIRLGTLSDDGVNVRYYCGRSLGVSVIPDSDGTCGPSDGPQCPDCYGITKDYPNTALQRGCSYGCSTSHGSSDICLLCHRTWGTGHGGHRCNSGPFSGSTGSFIAGLTSVPEISSTATAAAPSHSFYDPALQFVVGVSLGGGQAADISDEDLIAASAAAAAAASDVSSSTSTTANPPGKMQVQRTMCPESHPMIEGQFEGMCIGCGEESTCLHCDTCFLYLCSECGSQARKEMVTVDVPVVKSTSAEDVPAVKATSAGDALAGLPIVPTVYRIRDSRFSDHFRYKFCASSFSIVAKNGEETKAVEYLFNPFNRHVTCRVESSKYDFFMSEDYSHIESGTCTQDGNEYKYGLSNNKEAKTFFYQRESGLPSDAAPSSKPRSLHGELEVSKTPATLSAADVSTSSNSSGKGAIIDHLNLESCWTSSGSSGTHWVEIKIPVSVEYPTIEIYTRSDGSYAPENVSIWFGDGTRPISKLSDVALTQTKKWNTLITAERLRELLPKAPRVFRMHIHKNHGGCDCKVVALRMFASEMIPSIVRWDKGLALMSSLVDADAGDGVSTNRNEALKVLAIFCRICRASANQPGSSGLSRLISHDVLTPLLDLTFHAHNTSVRSAASTACAILLKYAHPRYGVLTQSAVYFSFLFLMYSCSAYCGTRVRLDCQTCHPYG
jgi:hypothetical protein